jgi:hypothetical protein
MPKKAGAIIITLILVSVCTAAALLTYKFLNPVHPVATSPTIPTPLPSAVPLKVEYSESNIDTQLDEVQKNIDQLNSDEKAYTLIDQNADSVSP